MERAFQGLGREPVWGPLRQVVVAGREDRPIDRVSSQSICQKDSSGFARLKAVYCPQAKNRGTIPHTHTR